MKICLRCRLPFPLTDFYQRSGEIGRRSWCKRCMIKKVQARRCDALIWASMGGAG